MSEINIGTYTINPNQSYSDKISQAICTAMKDNGSSAGKVCYEIDDDYKVRFAQWTDNAESVVGQYPDPNTDANRNYTFGYKN